MQLPYQFNFYLSYLFQFFFNMMLNIIKNFMSKKGTKIILQKILMRSPHYMMQRFNNVSYQVPCSDEKVSDQAYIDNTLSKLYCDFLISNQYSHIQTLPTTLLQDSINSQTAPLLKMSKQQKEYSQLQKKVISTIKKLQQLKHQNIVYDQAEDLVCNMTLQEAYSCKKYLMYIYKWILNQRARISTELQQRGQELKEVVVQKICDSHTKNEELVQVRKQMDRLQILAKARQYTVKGDREQAQINYQKVFVNLDNNENIRMEALQYLCKRSSEKGDLSYLLTMLNKIKQLSNQEQYVKYVETTLSKLTGTDGSQSSCHQ